jgi:threonine/homoserine efflux transporter RhtA
MGFVVLQQQPNKLAVAGVGLVVAGGVGASVSVPANHPRRSSTPSQVMSTA